ncbi:MAG: hypothetical protein ACK5RE_05445 [Pseudanabaena sp.]|jgi:hypothetical protein
MVIIKHPSLSRKYRAKCKRRAISPVKPTKRFSTIAYICKAIAISLFICIVPLLVVILPLALIVIAVVTFADKINQLGGCFENE